MSSPTTRRDLRATRRAAFRRFYLHTGASTLIPGSGLFGTRARRLGLILVSLFVLSLAYVLLKVATGGVVGTALSVGLNTTTMLWIMVGLVAGALLWIATVFLTSKLTRPQRLRGVDRWTVRLFTALCAVLIALPTAFGVRTLVIQRDLVSTVFQAVGAKATAGSNVQVEAKDPWENTPRVNVMLVGSDSGRDRIGIRSDSMMVASINTKTGDTVLVSLPRNLDYVPFAPDDPLHALYPNGFHCTDAAGINLNCLLNGVWTAAEDHKDLFPGDPTPGYTETRRTLGYVTGLPINQSVIIDLKGFQQLVDAMGGVTVDVKSKLCMHCLGDGYGGIEWAKGHQPEWIEPGKQRLNGEQALWFARSRAQSDDFDRMRRQRCLVGAMINQSNPVSLLANYGQLAAVFKHNVDIDIPRSDLPAWADLAQRVQGGTIKSLPITNKVVNTDHPDYDKIRRLVQHAINPKPTASPSSGSSATSASSTSSTKPSTSSGTPTDGLTDLASAC